MKRVTILGGTLVALVAVGGVYLKPQVLPQPKPITTHNTSVVSQPVPQPAPVAPATTTQTTTTTAPAPAPTTIFQTSNTDYSTNVAVTPDFAAPTNWKISYNYTCNGSDGVTIMYHSNSGTTFSFDQHGSTYTVTDIPIADAMTGHFRIWYPDAETCTWSLSVTN